MKCDGSIRKKMNENIKMKLSCGRYTRTTATVRDGLNILYYYFTSN